MNINEVTGILMRLQIFELSFILIIMAAGLRDYARVFDSPTRPKRAILPSDQTDTNPNMKNLDVFISYRRATGSLLARYVILCRHY